MNDTLANSLIETIEDETSNIVSDVGELTLNILIDNDSVISDIPFVSTAVSIYKIGHSIWELQHLKQLCIFVNAVRNETVDDKKRRKYIKAFEKKDEKTRNKELEYIVLICGKYIDDKKSKYLAKLFLGYIEGKMGWEAFVSYSEIIDRFLLGDYETLVEGEQNNICDNDVSDSVLRLVSLGLFYSVTDEVSMPNYPGNIVYPGNIQKNYRLTKFGRIMRDCLFNNI